MVPRGLDKNTKISALKEEKKTLENIRYQKAIESRKLEAVDLRVLVTKGPCTALEGPSVSRVASSS